MNCSQVQELLSAYLDGELTEPSRSRVAEHLVSCSACADDLSGFQRLSALADVLPAPMAPDDGWEQIAGALDSRSTVHQTDGRQPWLVRHRKVLALAATIMLVVGLGWTGHRIWAPHHQHARVFGHYLDEFQQDPIMAQRMLLAKYEGQALDVQRAVQRVGYRPAIADGLPEGYAVDSSFVMKMPCCTCVQTICKRRDGSMLVVFEHDDSERPQWFAGQSCIMANCGGQQCSLIGLDSQLAATWKRGNRHMTIVGARDVAEVDKLVNWLDAAREPAS